PPRGRALTHRPRELEARARFKFALGVGGRPATLARVASGPREATAAPPARLAAHGPTWANRAGGGGLWVTGQGGEGRHRYFPGGIASRRRREQPQSPTEFVSPVRSDPHTRARLATSGPTLARVAPGGAPPNHPAIPPPGPARANVARWSAGLLAPIRNPEARRLLP